MTRINLTVNGERYERNVEDHKNLLHFLREDLGLTGSKEGCGAGECGACTILMNGEAVKSCIILAVEADGAELQTIEGEAQNGELSDIQKAFDRNHAVQCGFCTPGMIMAVRDLITHNPKPNKKEILEGIESNFCRCTGYEQIVEAVQDVTGQLTEKGEIKHV